MDAQNTDMMLYEDDDVIITLPHYAAAKGEIQLLCKGNFVIFEQVPSNIIQKMFILANRFSARLFESVGCEGTNMLIQNGVPAGQTLDKFSIRILPRFENDNISFEWDRKQVDLSELDKTQSKFTDVERQDKEQKVLADSKKKAEQKPEPESLNENEDESDNYYIKHMNRIP